MLPGHETLKCFSCHKDEQGTFRQQLQTNIQQLLNNHSESVSVGLRPVRNNECIKCHERPNDRHPVYRFREPKYRKVREEINAHQCNTCHLEHKDKRITVSVDFCLNCHNKLILKNDPLDISHKKLIEEKRWDSCLTCHDYHGNHDMTTEHKMEKSIPVQELKKYFNRGSNPYSGNIIHKAIINNEK